MMVVAVAIVQWSTIAVMVAAAAIGVWDLFRWKG